MMDKINKVLVKILQWAFLAILGISAFLGTCYGIVRLADLLLPNLHNIIPKM